MHRLSQLVCALLAALLAAPALAQPVSVVGPAVTVVSHVTDACELWDIPDAPARAIRDASGTVRLFATHFRGRALVGPDLLRVRPACRIVYAGAESGDPARFDDRGWIASLYTADGATVFAIVHDEFQGHRHPGLCPTGRYLDCWYNALTPAVSTDGGRSFVRHPGLIAALPYRYDEVVGAHRGYFNPTGIVAFDGALYMMAFATQAKAQRAGTCLLRTDRIADPASWRAWDGTGFSMRFVDPYAGAITADEHVCAPVGVGRLRWPVTSLVRHAPSGRFIATMMDAASGVHVSTSRDLRDWSEPKRVLDARGPSAWQCGQAAPIAYPSLLDPDSKDRGFATVSDTAMLFYTRFNVAGCATGSDRDLVRIPVALSISSN